MELFLFRINRNITWQRCLFLRLHLTSEWEWYTRVTNKNDVPLALLPLVSHSECLDFLGFCSKPKSALNVKKDGKGTGHFLCCHTARASPGSPYISRWCQGWHWTQPQWGSRCAAQCQECCGVRAQLPPQLSSLQRWRASAQHVLLLQGMSLPQARAQPPALLLSTGTPSCCQPLPLPSGLQSLRGFHELQYLAHKQKMFLFPTAEPCSSLSSKHSHTCASWLNFVIWAVKRI